MPFLLVIKLRLSLPGAGNGLAGFLVGGATALGFAFVPGLFSFRQGDLTLQPSVFEVHASRNQCVPTLPGLDLQLSQFFRMDQKFARSKGGMVGISAMLVGAD